MKYRSLMGLVLALTFSGCAAETYRRPVHPYATVVYGYDSALVAGCDRIGALRDGDEHHQAVRAALAGGTHLVLDGRNSVYRCVGAR